MEQTSAGEQAIIEVRDLVKVYGGETRALDGITFSVAPGEVFGLLGPNSAGKTTTIRSRAGPHDVRQRLGVAVAR